MHPIHEIPGYFPDKREFRRGNGFVSDCIPHWAADGDAAGAGNCLSALVAG